MEETAYCEACEGERKVVKTVGWQADVCADCGNEIEG
ncbi:hypothetical protein SAMN05192554_12638 [Haloarchaeobius iranensis]|uniref:Uncharacterized protein n=1 Tax=Haloarchaeobius iranensis TaxID=996166 RepID=A0A1H0AD09_9EURY|nr:hypothetical protein SAMN05192554_12638 [Haloarchaeobius iranensis]